MARLSFYANPGLTVAWRNRLFLQIAFLQIAAASSRHCPGWARGCGGAADVGMKEVGLLEVALRAAAKVAAVAGVLAVVVWLSWVMLDVEHMNSGFTLP